MLNYEVFKAMCDGGLIDIHKFCENLRNIDPKAWFRPTLESWSKQALAAAQLPAAEQAERDAREKWQLAQSIHSGAKRDLGSKGLEVLEASRQLETAQTTLHSAVSQLQAARNALQDAQLDKADTAQATTVVNQWRAEVARLQEVVSTANASHKTCESERAALDQQICGLPEGHAETEYTREALADADRSLQTFRQQLQQNVEKVQELSETFLPSVYAADASQAGPIVKQLAEEIALLLVSQKALKESVVGAESAKDVLQVKLIGLAEAERLAEHWHGRRKADVNQLTHSTPLEIKAA